MHHFPAMYRNLMRAGFLLAAFIMTAQVTLAQEVEYHRQCYAPAGTITVGTRTLPSYGQPGTIRNANGRCEDVRSVLGRTGTVYWVDGQNGDNTNPGTESRPKKTIGSVTGATFLKPGDAVIIREGTYFEQVTTRATGTPGNPITFIGYPGEDVRVSGITDELTMTWTRHSGDIWKSTWPYGYINTPFDRSVNGKDPMMRRETIVHDNRLLRTAETLSRVQEGFFFIEGAADQPKGKTVYLQLPGGRNPNDERLYTARTDKHLWDNGNCYFDKPGQPDHHQLVNLDFEFAGNYGTEPAVCIGGEAGGMEDVSVRWTNGAGPGFKGGHNHGAFEFRDVRAFNNGMVGVRGRGGNQCVLDGIENAYNNWKQHKPAWESSMKFLETNDCEFIHVYSHDNDGPGLWLDDRNKRNLIHKSRFDNNLMSGVFIELHSDQNVVVNNVISRTREYNVNYYGVGVEISSSNGSLLAFNTFINNEGGSVLIDKDPRGQSQNSKFYNNAYLNSGGSSQLREINVGSEVNTSLSHYKSAGNFIWPHSGQRQDNTTFRLKETGTAVYTNDIGQWRSWTGTDQSSRMVATGQPHVSNLSSADQGWHLTSNSQLRGASVSIPSGDIPSWYSSRYQARIAEDFYGEPRPGSGADIGAHQFAGTVSNQAPSVQLTAPSGGSSFEPGTAIQLEAAASDVDGSVTRVAFFADGAKIGEATQAPFQASWTNASEGTYTLTARATDNNGATTTSGAVTITVAAGGTDPSPTPDPPPTPSDPQLRAAYTFQQGSDATTLADITGNGYDGALVNAPAWQESGLAFSSSTTGQHVSLPETLTSSGAQTLILAYKPLNAAQGDKYGFYASDTGNGAGPGTFQLDHDGQGGLRFLGTKADGQNLELSLGAADGAWHVFAVRWDPAAGTLDLFRDGTRVARQTGLSATDVLMSEGPAFGVNRATNRTSDGIIGYARFYSGALDDESLQTSSTEIAAIVGQRGDVATQTISLLAGWNLMSSAVAPSETDLDQLFADTASQITLMKDAAGNVYMPGQGIDNIGTWTPEKGYLIHVSEAVTLAFEGTSLEPENTPIALQSGWTLVPYLRATAMAPAEAFASIASELLLVKDAAGNVYMPGEGVDTIGQLQPGQAYAIYLLGEATLTYPANGQQQ